jgi:hypothetical protein
MIKADPKPNKKIEYYSIIAQLDKEYKVEVTKTTNGSTSYQVVSIEPKIEGDLHTFVCSTILNYCQREGLGIIENK